MFRRKQKTERPRVRDEKTTLASILISMRAITPSQLDQARAEREAHETSHADMLLASTLRAKGFCTSDDVSMALKIQSKMLSGDRANVALDLMEARLERYRVGEEQLRVEAERRREARLREEREEKIAVLPFSPVAAKAI